MLEIFSIITLFFLLIFSIYLNAKQLIKNEEYEMMVLTQNSFIEELNNMIKESSEKLKEIDSNGSFESDDEIGFFFKNLVKINDDIVDFYNRQTK